MDITVRKTYYFKVAVSDKPGEGARILGVLKEKGVNLLAVTGFPRGRRVQIDLVPENTAAFKRAMTQAGMTVSEKKTVFVIQGKDRPGAIAEVLEKLGKAGINVTALDAVTDGKGRFGSILWVKPADVAKAATVLKAS